MSTQFSTQQLQYLVAANQASTWTQAAKELQVSLSALSQGISELEKRIGMQLFIQNGKTRKLNPEAKEVLEYATLVCTQTKDLDSWLQSKHNAEIGELNIGMIDAAAIHHFPTQLKAFKDSKPKINVGLTVGPSGDLLNKLKRGEIHLAIIIKPDSVPEEIRVTELFDEPVGVYGPSQKTQNIKSWGPWVSFPKGSHTRRLVASSLSQLGAEFNVVAESHQPEVLKEMVNLGMGWAALPVSQAESGDNPLTRARKQPLCFRKLVCAERTSAATNPLTKEFIELIKLPKS